MVESPTVSVIMPAFNCANVISRSIKSVLSQSLPSFELIIVDDGSSDNTGSIIESFSKQDHRIKYYREPNSGVSCARNYGISQSSGRFITFVDSDDELKPHALYDLVQSNESHASDLVLGSYEVLDSNSVCFPVYEYPFHDYKSITTNGYDCIESLLSINEFSISGACWRALFSGKLIQDNHICFPVGIHMSEDFYFMLDVFRHVDSVVLSKNIVYRYHKNSNSVTNNYIPTIRHDMEYVNRFIYKVCRGDSRLLSLYRDCVANTSFFLIKNELYRRKGSFFSIRSILSDPKYLNSIRLLDSGSSLSRKRTAILRLLAFSPFLGALLCCSVLRSKIISSI